MNRPGLSCSTCGAQNIDGAVTCVECDEPISGQADEPVSSPGWLEAVPPWIRWIVALPGIAIVGSIVVRQLAYSGLDDGTSGVLYPSAIAFAIFAAALAAAFAAPSYRKPVGLAVALAELSVLYLVLLVVFVLNSYPAPTHPIWVLVVYAAIPTIGVVAAAFSIAQITPLADVPKEAFSLVGADHAARWWLAVLAAAGVAAAFEAFCVVVGVLRYSYLPIGVGNDLTAVIGTGIMVALVAEYSPSKKVYAAKITAGAFLVISAIGIALAVYYYVHFPFRVSNIEFDEALLALSSLSTICGALLGLRAATLRHDASTEIVP